jgi:hypothetical protein
LDSAYISSSAPGEQYPFDSKHPHELVEHDFLAMGISTEHIPELTKLILEEEYYISDDGELGSPQLFAYQALGQLKTETAIDAFSP